LRAWKTDGVDTHWKVYARNKRSLCLDLPQTGVERVAAFAVADGSDADRKPFGRA